MQSLLYGLFGESPWNSESVQIPYKIINDSLWAKLTCFPYNNIYIICYHYSTNNMLRTFLFYTNKFKLTTHESRYPSKVCCWYYFFCVPLKEVPHQGWFVQIKMNVTLNKIINTTHPHFCPHFSWAELKDLWLFLCTQKAYFSQILFTNLSKSVLESTSPLLR